MTEAGDDGVAPCIDSVWPERLRRGVRSVLRECGIRRSDWVRHGFDVHHVVAAGLGGALPGRRVLERWGVGIHTVANAAIIPRSFHRGEGLHRGEFLRIVNQRLSSAEIFAEALAQHGGRGAGRLILIETVQKIGSELVLRSGDVVAMRLQAALQRVVSASPGSGGSGEPLQAVRSAASVARGARERGSACEKGADRADATFRGRQRFGIPVAATCA